MRDAAGVDTLPLLPYCRRAPVDHREPGWRRVLQQELIRRAEVPVVGEHGQQVGRREEAGGQVTACLADQPGEPRRDGGPQVVRDQPERQRPDMRRLGLHGERPVRPGIPSRSAIRATVAADRYR
jgi:hypothetical protein